MSIYDYSAEDIKGKLVSLKEYQGHVLMIVNTASKCGFTPQFAELEALHRKYKDRGFAVLGFPCNQFKEQDPGDNEEILAFCQLNYGVTFPMFAKIDVNGEHTHPLFKYLREAASDTSDNAIEWNFTKFLVDRTGEVAGRFAPSVTPSSLGERVEALLGDSENH